MTNDKFRDALTIDFGDITIEDKKQLEILMRVAGYRRVYSKEENRLIKLNPKQTQLDFAWQYLKGNRQYKNEVNK